MYTDKPNNPFTRPGKYLHKAYAVKIQEKKRLKQSVKGQGYNRAGGRWLKNYFRWFSTDFRETLRNWKTYRCSATRPRVRMVARSYSRTDITTVVCQNKTIFLREIKEGNLVGLDTRFKNVRRRYKIRQLGTGDLWQFGHTTLFPLRQTQARSRA